MFTPICRSDVIAADIAEVFLESPGGLFDEEVSRRYFDIILQRANTVSAAEAFKEFRGRNPDPLALLRRFGLEAESDSRSPDQVRQGRQQGCLPPVGASVARDRYLECRQQGCLLQVGASFARDRASRPPI